MKYAFTIQRRIHTIKRDNSKCIFFFFSELCPFFNLDFLSSIKHPTAKHWHLHALTLPFPKRKIMDSYKFKTIADDNKCNFKAEILFRMGRKQCGIRRKCWLPTFSPFRTMFSRGFIYRVFRSLDCVVKSLTHYQTTNFRLFQTERVCRQQF